MLIVSPNDTFKVNVIYTKDVKGEIKFLNEKPETGEANEEWFEFRRPNWSDVQIIMRNATNNGLRQIDQLDAMSFMDAKIRVLLKSWSLKDEKGKSLTLDNVDKLPTSVIMHLSGEVDKELGPNGLFGASA